MRRKTVAYAVQARLHGYSADVLTWHTALDNYEPCPRAYANGYAVKYAGTLHDPETGFTAEYPTAGIIMPLTDSGLSLDNLIKAIALFDYGDSVQPYYMAGWNDRNREWWGLRNYVMWHPFPTAQPGEMTQGNPSRPLDYSSWQLGPRKTYHFKVSPLHEHSYDAAGYRSGTIHCITCGEPAPVAPEFTAWMNKTT
jgi:hypothetical protein